LKPAALRPQARRDRQDEIRYYRIKASSQVAKNLVAASRLALEQLQQNPGMGSPRIGQILDIPGLRSWSLSGFPLLWFYFERADHLDVVRLLGERQDNLSILGDYPNAETRTALAEAD
jgi:toxin ParE1/3/4